MKKILLSSLAISLILPFFASAQNGPRIDTARETREQAGVRREAQVGSTTEESIRLREREREEVQERIMQIKTEVAERKAQTQNQIQNGLLNLHEISINRFEAGINRLNTLADRIESRIEKIESANINMSESRTLLTTARNKIKEASDLISSVSIDPNLDYENKTELIESFRNLQIKLQEIRTAIRSAHSALVDVIVSIKPGQAELDSKQTTE